MVAIAYHPVCGSTYRRVTWVTWCGKVCAAGCAWCLRGAMLLRGFRLFGVALHREAKAHKRVAVRYPELVQLSTEDSELSCGMHRRISVQQSRT